MSHTWSCRLRLLGLAMACLVLLASQALAQINSTSGNSLTVHIGGTEVARFTSGNEIDLLSNGFKMRNTDTGRNANGGTYTYAAFAEQPFKYARGR